MLWRALTWLNLYGCEAVRLKPKNSQKTPKTFFACFWAYVRQPHSHISWAIPMPFASINSTNQRTNPWNFQKKNIENWRSWKMTFWGFFLVFGYWIFLEKSFFSMIITMVFIWVSLYFCTMDVFFRILKKALSELICLQLYTYKFALGCCKVQVFWEGHKNLLLHYLVTSNLKGRYFQFCVASNDYNQHICGVGCKHYNISIILKLFTHVLASLDT